SGARCWARGGARMAMTRNVWGYIDQRDRRIMRRVNRWQAPRWVRIFMIVWTRLGDGLLWYAVGLALLVFGHERGIHAFFASAVAAFASIALFRQVKRLSRRARPCHVEPHCWSLITPPDQFSFPSGHAMTSFAIAVALAHFYPDFEPLL